MIQLSLGEIARVLQGRLIGSDIPFTGCYTDTRKPLAGGLYVALKGQQFDGHEFLPQVQAQGACAALVEQDNVKIDLPMVCVANTWQAVGQLAHYWRERFNPPVVAVTGSNGKTTVKEMTRQILAQAGQVLATQGNLNNEIGLPLTLFQLEANHDFAVLEMGASKRGDIAYLSQIAQPSIAVVTLCAPSHLDGFKSVEGVARTKGEIFEHLPMSGIAVINQDDFYSGLWQELAGQRKIITFGLHKLATITAYDINLAVDHTQFILVTPLGEISIFLPLAGQHNVMNALAASACALASGCTLSHIQQGLNSFSAVKGRLQCYQGVKHCTVIDDTYNANPQSFQAALAVLSRYNSPRWLVMGDMKELGEQSAMFHQQLGESARQLGIARLWAVGDMSRFAVTAFGQGASHWTNQAAMISALLTELSENTTLLIKGSRSMQMEKVVQALTQGE
ncbi:UDP-N-acetylmuramoyl-tripeptide--D-alanyl-D-alanine ligase [Beggiatoa leptomitoformis]|uniref:UDP-N-acetylmuramoyl-tripeptide--D-alanyl-D-alanine ligase n=2 Tax=Beggiatoa leptomitoformis TaxID=288004 RepID=A0A2N9YIG2_9GAMM|nr:UDP-N-acetylmuramoyl-tripeptide--D-alanyl-D-alanine ligase [Beggiatoa leptomitoformis]AUI70280.1 UDP-N-acetylmuramoyl-tripeptide--D-alanyl-D-alanine ligase [Beggiatoa leptomitoformis]